MATNKQQGSGTSNRGFASMDPQRQREIASQGGKAAHEKGTAHEFTSEEARRAGSMSHGNRQSANASVSASGKQPSRQGGKQQPEMNQGSRQSEINQGSRQSDTQRNEQSERNQASNQASNQRGRDDSRSGSKSGSDS
ncbi:KGG domain-containing protein [Massilia cavernae]|uniref:KGG domain-containing protein n=1 Tax=Massilia cavernae TaxID=2320864 RepID=UPI001E439A01|nr:KGG domain-containing protein [Massilia cavernae]